MPPTFRVNAKCFFLTYPQCDISKEDLLEHLDSFKPVWIVVGRELHEDGQPHLHACVSFGARKDVRDERHFDFRDSHCNIQPARNPTDCYRYCTKGGDSCTKGPVPIRETWKDIVATRSQEEFLSKIRSLYPRDWVLSNERILAYAQTQYDRNVAEFVPTWTSFDIPNEVEEWIDTEFLNGTS